MIPRYSRPAMARVWSDERRYELWLKVELAACEAWADLGAIPKADLLKLRGAKVDQKAIERAFQVTKHDVTAFLQGVSEGLGPESRFIHLGLTSNDVMDSAQALQMVEAAGLLEEGLGALQAAVERLALQHKDTLMMGRTHGVHAEPITFGLKLAVWVDELRRQRLRLAQAKATVAVGKLSGPVGSHASVPPEVEEGACQRLGLAVEPASTQIVQRDRHAHFVTALALIGASLEKFATEVRGLQRTEVREVEEPFEEGQTGSSAMPHKRNPELSERVCGLARLLRGHALTALENVALWHERDISHSSAERIILPDSCLALDYMLATFTHIVEGLRVYPQRMRRNLEASKGLVFSQRVLLALIAKGLGRQDAYKLVQRSALRAWDSEADFLTCLKGDREVTARFAEGEIEALFDYGVFLKYVDATFKRLGLV